MTGLTLAAISMLLAFWGYLFIDMPHAIFWAVMVVAFLELRRAFDDADKA